MKKIGAGTVLALLALLLIPAAGLALDGAPSNEFCEGGTSPLDPGCVPLDSVGKVMNLIWGLLGLLRTIFWIVAVAMLLWAAYLFLVGGANPKAQEAAKVTIRYAVIAIVLALVATSIPFLVQSLLGGRSGP